MLQHQTAIGMELELKNINMDKATTEAQDKAFCAVADTNYLHIDHDFSDQALFINFKSCMRAILTARDHKRDEQPRAQQLVHALHIYTKDTYSSKKKKTVTINNNDNQNNNNQVDTTEAKKNISIE